MGYAAAESARPVINADGLRGMLMATAARLLAGNVLFACVSSGGDSGGGGDGGGE